MNDLIHVFQSSRLVDPDRERLGDHQLVEEIIGSLDMRAFFWTAAVNSFIISDGVRLTTSGEKGNWRQNGMVIAGNLRGRPTQPGDLILGPNQELWLVLPGNGVGRRGYQLVDRPLAYADSPLFREAIQRIEGMMDRGVRGYHPLAARLREYTLHYDVGRNLDGMLQGAAVEVSILDRRQDYSARLQAALEEWRL